MFKWSEQVILLTGGTGSFGHTFTRLLLLKHPPKVLRIFSRDEYKQFLMQKEFNHPSLRFLIGDVRDYQRLKRAMDGVTMVIHAAAMKQIVASEYNPSEAIKTNVIGTMNVLEAALDVNVERLIGLITDKAVSPINLYGATKLCVEKLLIQGNSYVGQRKTKISCIRYGNVAGSRGSVIPQFFEQLKQKKLRVTHKDMTRFWITLPEATSFVIEMIKRMEGGEIFIPKMPSFRIIDLAKIIAPEAKLTFTGIRPGEKLHEDLVTIHEARNIREFANYFILEPEFDFWLTRGPSRGKKVAENFFYCSQNNTRWLTQKDLKRLMRSLDGLSQE